LPHATGQSGDQGFEVLPQNAALLEVIIHRRRIIQTAQRPLQPQAILAVQNADDSGLVALYKSTVNIVRRRTESCSHDSHLHHQQSSAILVAA
jgi:hypothetical protein